MLETASHKPTANRAVSIFYKSPVNNDLSKRLRGINPTNTVFFSSEPPAEVFCSQLNFKISKLVYSPTPVIVPQFTCLVEAVFRSEKNCRETKRILC